MEEVALSTRVSIVLLVGARGRQLVATRDVISCPFAGVWRGMPVAVKTMVFEAWEGDEGVTGGDKARMRYVRAIMETALSASLGHLHVVSGGGKHVMASCGLPPLDFTPCLTLEPSATQSVQVATYHYDIKRMDDTAASTTDGLQASLLRGKGSSRSLLCFALTSPFPIPTPLQVTMADQALDQAQPSSSPAAPSVKTFKVFLVQVGGWESGAA